MSRAVTASERVKASPSSSQTPSTVTCSAPGSPLSHKGDNFVAYYRSTPKISLWWEEVTGTELTVSLDYLLDHSTPWTSWPNQHILRPCGDNPTTAGTGNINISDRIKLLEQITKIFIGADSPAAQQQPHLSFYNEDVEIAELDGPLLEAIWHNPPNLNGKPLEFLSRGLPYPDCHVGVVTEGRAMKREELVKKIADCNSSRSEDDRVGLVVAQLYQSKLLRGGPMFSGELYVLKRGSIRTVGDYFCGWNLEPVEYTPI